MKGYDDSKLSDFSWKHFDSKGNKISFDSLKALEHDMLDDIVKSSVQEMYKQQEQKMLSLLIDTFKKYIGIDIDADITANDFVAFIQSNGYEIERDNLFSMPEQPVPEYRGDVKSVSLVYNEVWNLNHLIVRDKKTDMAYTASGIIAPYPMIHREIARIELSNQSKAMEE